MYSAGIYKPYYDPRLPFHCNTTTWFPSHWLHFSCLQGRLQSHIIGVYMCLHAFNNRKVVVNQDGNFEIIWSDSCFSLTSYLNIFDMFYVLRDSAVNNCLMVDFPFANLKNTSVIFFFFWKEFRQKFALMEC